MFIKRFEAPTLAQAVEQVRGELGSDALVLSVRTLKSRGGVPWLRRTVIEVVAAQDPGDDVMAPLPDNRAAQEPQQLPPSPPPPAPLSAGLDDVEEGLTPAEAPADALHDIGEYLEPMMQQIAELKEQLARGLALRAPVPPRPSFEGVTQLEHLLTARGLKAPSIARIVSRVVSESSGADLADAARTYARARDTLRRILADSRAWGDACQSAAVPRRVALIGPTGVGKTTTIAKLAARYSLMQNKLVSLVAADTYRVAAVSQLRMYGQLLGVEVDVVHEPSEMAAAVARHMNKDIVLIDTAGRGPRNAQGMEALRALLTAAAPAEVHLVLSATTKSADLVDIMERFGPLGYDRLLFTKLDESDSCGDMVDAILGSCVPVSFLTTGQSVPNDIEVSTADRIVSLLLPEISVERELRHVGSG